MNNQKIGLVFGTRPELIKLAPIILDFKREGLRDKLWIVDTGQHQDLIEQYLKVFDIVPDIRLQGMRHGQSLSHLQARLLTELQNGIQKLNQKQVKLTALIAQGDTATVLATALAATFNQIPFFHVEAGLRSHDLSTPFPEEYNRRMAALNAHFHYAPTSGARANLVKEGIAPEKIEVTGNTIVDAMLYMRKIASGLSSSIAPNRANFQHGKGVLITCHRRENQGENILELKDSICNETPRITFFVARSS